MPEVTWPSVAMALVIALPGLLAAWLAHKATLIGKANQDAIVETKAKTEEIAAVTTEKLDKVVDQSDGILSAHRAAIAAEVEKTAAADRKTAALEATVAGLQETLRLAPLLERARTQLEAATAEKIATAARAEGVASVGSMQVDVLDAKVLTGPPPSPAPTSTEPVQAGNGHADAPAGDP